MKNRETFAGICKPVMPLDISPIEPRLARYSPGLRQRAIVAIRLLHLRLCDELVFSRSYLSQQQSESRDIFNISFEVFAHRLVIVDIEISDKPRAGNKAVYVIRRRGAVQEIHTHARQREPFALLSPIDADTGLKPTRNGKLGYAAPHGIPGVTLHPALPGLVVPAGAAVAGAPAWLDDTQGPRVAAARHDHGCDSILWHGARMRINGAGKTVTGAGSYAVTGTVIIGAEGMPESTPVT